jgi:DNA ligase-1
MVFSELASHFEKLETTSSRIEITQMLSQMFKTVSGGEVEKVAYLLQGRVAPFFEPIEIGMADKMVDQALASAYSVDRKEVQRLAIQSGDMGLAAEKLAEKNHKGAGALSVEDVHKRLYEIATTSGEGSVEKKINFLADILKDQDPKGAKYLVRITLSKLRLGVGDPTILDALSQTKFGDKSARPKLEEAYNKTSDLGFVAKILWSKGLGAVEKVEIQVGKPVRPALAERLPDAEAMIKRVGDEFAAEPKYDGFRNQVHLNRMEENQVQIFSRNLENMTHMFPDILEAVKKEVRADSAIFEGEAIAYNPTTEEFLPFQETTKRRRKYGVKEFAEKLPLKLFAFDLLYLNGKDITKLPYRERRKKLGEILSKEGQVLIAQEKILHSAKELKEMFEEKISEGLEGVMVKKLDSPYKAGGRGFHWIKFKRVAAGELSDTIDCVLLGIYSGTGKRAAFGAGGLLVGLYDDDNDVFKTVSRLGTGLTDEEWKRIYAIAQKIKVSKKPARVDASSEPSFWVEPKEVLEVFADEITRSPIHTAGKKGDEPGYALRFPRLVSFRGLDKRAEDATTVKELIAMYRRQRKVKV